MRTLITLLMALLFAHAVNACCIAISRHTIKITDANTGKPVVNAALTLLDKSKILRTFNSDTAGTIRFSYFEDKELTLIVRHADFNTFETKLKFSEEKRMSIIILLSNNGKSDMVVKDENTKTSGRGYLQNTRVYNTLQEQQTNDISFNAFTCRIKHADRDFESYLFGNDRVFNELLVFPNPANRDGTLYVESKFGGNKFLHIYNLSGTLMYSSEIVFHTSINLSVLTPGLYIVKIIDSKNDDVTVSKLLIK